MNKLPRLTLYFWVMKVCATTLGETAGDLLSMTLHLGYALGSLVLLGIFLAALGLQLGVRRYHPVLYWLVILATSTVATTLSDFLDRSLGLGYLKGAAILLGALLALLAWWRFSGFALSVESVRAWKPEMLYWLGILLATTLGTALGDFLADDAGLGFARAALALAALVAGLALALRHALVSRVSLFWLAFVLTRSLGACLGDLFTKAPAQGGLGFGTVGISFVLTALLGWLVLRSTRIQDHLALRGGVPVE